DFGAAVFVVQHLSPHTTSHAPELMARNSALPVRYATDRELMEPGHVYVGPTDHHLVIERGRMRLQHSPKDPWNRPSINVLFRSASAAYGSVVAGVILSGSMQDGIAGLWEIKNAGGVTIVQSPEDAEWRDMPQAALANVPVDHCIPADAI